MREIEYKNWLEKNGRDAETVQRLIDNVKAIEQKVGDLDDRIIKGDLDELVSRFEYSKEDKSDLKKDVEF